MFESHFEAYIKQCRWFGGKGRSIKEIKISDTIKLPSNKKHFEILILEIFFSSGAGEFYLLPIGFDETKKPLQGEIAKVRFNNKEGFLYEAIFDEKFRLILLDFINRNKKISTKKGNLIALRGRDFESFLTDKELPKTSHLSLVQQSNTSFFYNDVFFLKLYRRLQNGINPEVELTKYLTEHTNFDNFPAFAGSIEWKAINGETKTLALLQEYVPNQGDAWGYFSNSVKDFLKNAIQQSQYEQTEELLDQAIIQNTILLGKRTAQFHTALAEFSQNRDINPEPVSQQYLEFLYESSNELAHKVFDELNFGDFADLIKDDIAKLISIKDSIFERIEEIKTRNLTGKLIRTHGDYHLGQVLFIGNDFIISDFEGEPTRSFVQRQQKHIALRDVAGMIRSFRYAAYNPIVCNSDSAQSQKESIIYWSQQWYQYISETFLNSYLNNVKRSEFLPNKPDELEYMLDFYMLEKAIYELDYELHNRPSWLIVAAKGILQIVSKSTEIHQFPRRV